LEYVERIGASREKKVNAKNVKDWSRTLRHSVREAEQKEIDEENEKARIKTTEDAAAATIVVVPARNKRKYGLLTKEALEYVDHGSDSDSDVETQVPFQEL
jgi:hypothetical protein